MTKRIKCLTVDKISLLTSEHQPAVPKAGLGYSILKFFRTRKISKADTKKLDSVLASLDYRLESVLKRLEPYTLDKK